MQENQDLPNREEVDEDIDIFECSYCKDTFGVSSKWPWCCNVNYLAHNHGNCLADWYQRMRKDCQVEIFKGRVYKKNST